MLCIDKEFEINDRFLISINTGRYDVILDGSLPREYMYQR